VVGAIPENKGPNMRWVEDLTKVVNSAKERKKEIHSLSQSFVGKWAIVNNK
jgi:hypothetical protein